jgi:hypothetical protein
LNLDVYAKAHGLRYTLRKNAGQITCEWSKDSLKKRLLTALTADQVAPHANQVSRPTGAEWIVRVEAAAKFNPEDFLREAFRLPTPDDWVRVRATQSFHADVLALART